MKNSTLSPQVNGLAATEVMPMADLAVNESASADVIRSRIFTIRGVQVMLDRDLAELYGVPTKRLNDEEVQEIFAGGYDVGNRSRSQIATLNKGRGHNINTAHTHLPSMEFSCLQVF